MVSGSEQYNNRRFKFLEYDGAKICDLENWVLSLTKQQTR